ncbi:DUF1254 domain-containing protein [Vibrio rotiferianus]|uniref:DUF1254 domain-containing protein n=1 Tax=Vibrio rotiferianus TaxID=190895 RepID=UPI00406AAF27
MKKTLLAASLALLTTTVTNASTTLDDTDFTGLRVYHHMENMVEHIKANGINEFEHSDIADHTFFVITPALDHLYSKAVLDVRNGPVILETPPRDNRYASVQIIDSEHFTLYAEASPQEGGKYLITRKGADYGIPEGDFTEIIEVNDDLPFLFIRTETKMYRDDGYADQNRRQLKLTPVVAAEPITLPSTQDPREVLNFAMSLNDGWEETEPYMLNASTAYTYERYEKTVDYITSQIANGVLVNNEHGFEPPTHPDANGDNLTRAAITHIGHLGFPAYHAYYENIPMSPEGKPLNGSEPFVLTMEHNLDLDYFWSVTRYSSATRLPLDPATIDGSNRQAFALHNTMPDENGMVTITFSAEDPQDGTYWMPVIDGEQYYFVARYYGPREGLQGKTAASIMYKGTPLETIFAPKASF